MTAREQPGLDDVARSLAAKLKAIDFSGLTDDERSLLEAVFQTAKAVASDAEVEAFGCPTDGIGGARVLPETYGEAFDTLLYAAQTGQYCAPVKPTF